MLQFSRCASGAFASLVSLVALPPAQAAQGERITVTGEVVDSWCTISQVMGYALGTAHYQCAVWCAAGGIPVSIKTEDDRFFMILKIGEDTESVANPRIVDFQAHQVTVDGEHYERDGVNYLLIDAVSTDAGIVNLSHEDYGIVPFGE